MRRNRKVALGLGLVAIAATALSACSSSGGGSTGGSGGSSTGGSSGGSTVDTSPNTTTGYNSAANNVINKSTKTGGTLNLLTGGDCDSWDPARTYYGWCFNMQRLISRTLIGYSKVNGAKFTLAPDLATTMGTHDADFKTWTYTLKSGLKYSNGQAIKPIDIKYAVSRVFATDIINGGPFSYFNDVIQHAANYKGVYKSGMLPDSSISTTANTITFHLSQSYADFDYLLALPTIAPVPANVEGGAGFKGSSYTKHPVASGPYEFKTYVQAQKLVLVRNPYWSQSTDTIRKPLVNEVDLTVDKDSDDIDQKLQAGTADARADLTVQPTFQSKILQSSTLKAHADDPKSAFTRFLVVSPSVIPNVHCRLAIMYGINKQLGLRAYGGPYAGQIAASITPPGITGYQTGDQYDPYPNGDNELGNASKAKDELKQCGKPNGFSTKFAYSTASPQPANFFKAEQPVLAKLGIKITAAPADQQSYYTSFIGSPANIKNQGLGISMAGWGADFPTPYGYFNSIANGKSILPNGNSNWPSLNDPTVNKILDAGPAGKNTTTDWQNLNHAVMKAAVYVPIFWGQNLYYRNPRLTNVTSNNALAFGIYDFVNMGV